MSGFALSIEDRDCFLKALKATKKPALEHRRMNALLLLDDGMAVAAVARVLYVDARTVEEYRRLYKTGGASGVSALGYKGNPFSVMTAEETAALKAHMAGQVYMTSQAVCDHILEECGHVYTPNAMTKLLKRIGCS